MRKFAILILWLSLAMTVHAQSTFPNQSWEVYLMRGVTTSGLDRLTFIDVLTGDTRTTEVSGERYTILDTVVLYFDYVNQRVMMVGVDSIPRPHPFVQMPVGSNRIDWVVSPDGREIAWTVTSGTPNALTTVTTVANADGANRRDILVDGARDGVRAMPVAFNAEMTQLFMDIQPDGISDFTPYTQYAGLFSVDLTTKEIQTLPNEPSCFCGAGFLGELFIRLGLTSDFSGFDVNFYDLQRNNRVIIPALSLNNLTQAGDVLIAPNGELAVYALSQIENFGTPRQSVQTVFVLVDLRQMTQVALTDPITTYVHPLRWTEENTAIIFTSPQVNGTWKISLETKQLKQVAEATYIGLLTVTN